MVGKMSPRVPRSVWLPIADRLAGEYGITRDAMLYIGGRARLFYYPRVKFWRELRAMPANYSLTAIAAISGHDHTCILHAMKARKDVSAPLAEITPREKPGCFVGRIFQSLTVVSLTGKRTPNNARIWLCHCAVCQKDCEISTAGLSLGSECPTCKRAAYSHRIEQRHLHHKVRARAYG